MGNDSHGEPPITVTSNSAEPTTEPSTTAAVVTAARPDVWDDVVQAHDLGERHHDSHDTGGRSPWLLPTHGARLVVTAGWAGLVVADVLLLSALMPSFRRGLTEGYVVSLEDHQILNATLLGSTVVLLLGWTWWSLSATMNARKVHPMATTPMLPAVAYLGAPIVFMFGADRSDADRLSFMIGAAVLLIVGHLSVVLSLKGTSARIRAATDEFSKLFWLPLAWVSYRIVVSAFADELDPAWRTMGVLVGLGAIETLFLVALLVSSWRAMTSFDNACHRLATRTLGNELPPPELIASVLRHHAVR
jgi:hypothetical protein